MKAGLLILGCTVAAANVFMFIFMVNMVRLNAVGPSGVAIDSYDAISIQIMILTVILGAVALGLAVAAFFGYQALENIVLRHADEVVSKRLVVLDSSPSPERPVAAQETSAAPPAKAEEEGKT